jgi:preprotein translocase subunit SecE
MTWIQEYIKSVYSEMQKVSWPSRDELISSTLITLVATVIISALIYAADQVISTTLTFIYN